MTAAAIPDPRRKPRRTNWERTAWVFMRVSGVVLVVLIFTHLYVNLMVGDGIRAIDFAFVAGKFSDPFWQWWDFTMLVLAMVHGSNGMRTIVNDYVVREGARKFFNYAIAIAAVVLIVLGTLVIFTFDPCLPNADGSVLESVCSV